MGYRIFGQVISREEKIADFAFRKRAANPHPVFLEVPAGLFNGFPTWVFYTMPEKFEQAPLVLRWCLLFTLIRHESGAFQKRSSNRGNLERLTLRFSVHGNNFENAAIRIQWRHDRDNHVIYLSEVSSNTNAKCPVIVALINFSGVVWTENIWCVFRVKPPFSNFSSVVVGACLRMIKFLIAASANCTRQFVVRS